MKESFLHLGCAALALALSAGFLAACTVPTVSTTAVSSGETLLYDASALDDGQLRILTADHSSTVLCGSTVLLHTSIHQSVTLLPDTLTGEVSYYWVCSPDAGSASGRSSILYDKTGTPLLCFDQEYTATLTGDLLLLARMPWLEFRDSDIISPGDCRVVELATGQELPCPTNAYQCHAVGSLLAFNCYERPAGLAKGEWDTDCYLHTRMLLTDRAGNVLLEEAGCTASGFSAADQNSLPTDWIALDFYRAAPEEVPPSLLYQPSTGLELTGFYQACGSHTACFETADGRYVLLDLNRADARQPLYTAAVPILCYLPGTVVTRVSGSEQHFCLHDLANGEEKELYAVDYSDDALAVYALDGTLRVYDRATGDLRTDVNAPPPDGLTMAQLSLEGGSYAMLKLYSGGSYSTSLIQLYHSQGLVQQITPNLPDDGYYFFSSLSQADGSPYFRCAYHGPNGSVLYDVLDAEGGVLLQGLSLCYPLYGSQGAALPEGAFVARRGFLYGWMTPDGQWLYCQSIFSSVLDEEPAEYYL